MTRNLAWRRPRHSAALISAFVLIAGIGDASAVRAAPMLDLPPQVDTDRLVLAGKEHTKRADYASAASDFSDAAKRGGKLPSDFAIDYAKALSGSGDRSKALLVVKTWLKTGSGSARYKEALGMLVSLQDQTETASATSLTATKPKLTDMCPRTALPFTLSEAVWAKLEGADAYRQSQPQKPLTLTFSKSQVMNGRGFKTNIEEEQTVRFSPLTPCIGSAVTQDTQSSANTIAFQTTSIPAATTQYAIYYALNGLLALGASSNGKLYSRLSEIDAINGSLFPMQRGASIEIRYKLESSGSIIDAAIACKVGASVPATSLDDRLHGDAWNIQCTANGAQSEDYYLADLGVMKSRLDQSVPNGAGGYILKLPVPGQAVTQIIPGISSGATNTEKYNTFEWR